MLEHLGLIGVSWRQGGSEALTEFALDQERAPDKLRDFAQRLGLKELAYLSTCNRVELIFARGERTPGQDLRAPAFALLHGFAEHPKLARSPLWLAHWTTGAPTVPAPWSSWTLWQTGAGRLPGIHGLVDLDCAISLPGET